MPRPDPVENAEPEGSDELARERQTSLETAQAENTSLKAALRVSEERYRTLLHSGTNAVFRTDGRGEQMIEVSGGLSGFVSVEHGGSPVAEWIAKHIYPEDGEQTLSLWREAMEHKRPYHNIHRLILPEGGMRYAVCRAVPMFDDSGEVQEWIGTIADVTEQRRAEEALRESEERLRLILENAREYAIISMDLDRRVTSWNAGAEIILRYSESEIVGEVADIIFTPEDRSRNVPAREADAALRTGRALDERWHMRKDGSSFWASGVMTPMRDGSGRAVGLLKIMRDQTEQLRSQEALEESRRALQAALNETERARAEAEAASRAKDQFLAVLSHELRTPLTPVLMAARILSRDPSLSDTARDAVGMIQRNVQLEARFVDDLLDVTRINRGKMEVVKGRMDLHDAILHAVEISRADADARGQRLTVTLEAREHVVQGDSERLQQVIWNLLKNASKFTPDGGTIALRSWSGSGRIFVEVKDTGMGFEPATASRIFVAFEQANEDVARRFGGLGLGLAISKATVDAHGGRIEASSEGLNLGATFTINLPLEP